MGREVKRLPLDFVWPIGKLWDGYVMPEHLHSIPCKHCGQSGYNAETRVIADSFYDHEGHTLGRWGYDYNVAPDGSPATRPPWRIWGDCRSWSHNITQDEADALVEKGRLYDLTHTFEAGMGWRKKDPQPVVTAAEVNAWSHTSMSHDAINRFTLVEVRARRYGCFGHCEHCDGKGETWRNAEHEAANEAWTPTEPPSGDGWSMWSTTTEGHPISPVFATPEELASWLASTKASAFGYSTATFDEWLDMITGSGWAMSAVVEDGEMKSGVAAMADRDA